METNMSQLCVERIIGLLVTDEGLRRRFREDAHAALQEMIERGLELNDCELSSLASLDAREITRFARAVDPRLQKIDVRGGRSWNS
jgi:cobalamin biosynthesis Mg chelatase CobN